MNRDEIISMTIDSPNLLADKFLALEAEIDRLKEAIDNAIYNQECERGCDSCANNEALFKELNDVAHPSQASLISGQPPGIQATRPLAEQEEIKRISKESPFPIDSQFHFDYMCKKVAEIDARPLATPNKCSECGGSGSIVTHYDGAPIGEGCPSCATHATDGKDE